MADPITVPELSMAIVALQSMHPVNCDIDPKALDALNKANRQFLADQITAVLRDPKANTPHEWREGGKQLLQIRRLADVPNSVDPSASSTSTCLLASTCVFRKLTDLILHQRALKAIG
jgi:hypothetical protein